MVQLNITSSIGPTGGWHSADFKREVVGANGKRGQNPTTLSLLGEHFADRFWVFVEKSQSCWLWTAGKDAYGYGQIHRPRKTPIKAHRAAWILAHGPIGYHQHVLHSCDIRHCVNPDHLFLGDQAANMKDAAAKGRLHVPRPSARKLTAEAELRILQAPAQRGVTVRLAREFGITKSYVSKLRRGRRVRKSVANRAGAVAS